MKFITKNKSLDAAWKHADDNNLCMRVVSYDQEATVFSVCFNTPEDITQFMLVCSVQQFYG